MLLPEVDRPRDHGDKPACRIILPCTPEYRRWARDLADHLGMPVSVAISQGLLNLADLTHFARPPKRYRRRSEGVAGVRLGGDRGGPGRDPAG